MLEAPLSAAALVLQRHCEAVGPLLVALLEAGHEHANVAALHDLLPVAAVVGEVHNLKRGKVILMVSSRQLQNVLPDLFVSKVTASASVRRVVRRAAVTPFVVAVVVVVPVSVSVPLPFSISAAAAAVEVVVSLVIQREDGIVVVAWALWRSNSA